MNIVLCVPTCNNAEYEINGKCCTMCDPGKSDCPSLITTTGEVRYLKGSYDYFPPGTTLVVFLWVMLSNRCNLTGRNKTLRGTFPSSGIGI